MPRVLPSGLESVWKVGFGRGRGFRKHGVTSSKLLPVLICGCVAGRSFGELSKFRLVGVMSQQVS